MNLAGLPALVVPCGLAKGGPSGLPVGLQMIGPAFGEVDFEHFLEVLRVGLIRIANFNHGN